MIRKIYFIFIMSTFAIFSLVNYSGFGMALNTDSYLRLIIYFFAIFTFFILQSKTKKIADTTDVIFILFLILVFEGASSVNGYTGTGITYLSFYICVYLIAMQEFKNEYLFYTSAIFAMFGTGLLLILKFGSVLSGWNHNTMAIICFQSFMVFFSAFKTNSKTTKVVYMTLILLNILLLGMLDCRSAMMCILLAVVLSSRPSIIDKVISNKFLLTLFLLLPLIISLLTVAFSQLPIVQQINEWSIEHLSKPLFNGRDTIWSDGFERFLKKPLFGYGEIYSGYWHNSAVACLYSYGIIGYMLYITVFQRLLYTGKRYLNDVIVRKCTIAFLIVNFQQSFENTLFVAGGIYIPYVILGILLGRIRYLKGKDLIEKNQHYCTSI